MLPNMTTLYQNEQKLRQEQYDNYPVPAEDIAFDVRVDTELRRVSCVLVIWAVQFQDCAAQFENLIHLLIAGVPKHSAPASRVQGCSKGAHGNISAVPHRGAAALPINTISGGVPPSASATCRKVRGIGTTRLHHLVFAAPFIV